MPESTGKLHEEINNLRRATRERTIGYIVAAFGLVAGLAWNDAVHSLIDYLFPATQNTLLAKFLYAGILTVIVVALTVQLTKFASENGKK